jgi:hypothetical protein
MPARGFLLAIGVVVYGCKSRLTGRARLPQARCPSALRWHFAERFPLAIPTSTKVNYPECNKMQLTMNAVGCRQYEFFLVAGMAGMNRIGSNTRALAGEHVFYAPAHGGYRQTESR